ncbi:hypothetical protein CISIN_1g041583mg, partial [Citrus sinensis]
MAITIFQSCKKRKRVPNIFNINNFATQTSSLGFHGPFRENIRLFLREYAETEDYKVQNNPIWCTLLLSESNGVVFPLYTLEESIKQSSHPFCNLCRCVGWSHHFVCKRRYHFIIPQHEKWIKPLNMDTLEHCDHILHGVVHCNGFGHLLSISGSKDGSNYLCEEQIMNLFDHLCTILHTQKISVHDVLVKRCMDLRLLHCVTYGCSWFGKWDYKFCHGSFGVTEHKYNRAIQILSSLELKRIIHDFGNTGRGRVIGKIIHLYMNASDTQLITISDLLQWGVQRLEQAAKAIFTTLEQRNASINSKAKISRRELRDEARKKIGDTGLLDFMIKHIHKIILDNRIVHRKINPATKLAEFSLEDDANGEVIQTRTEPEYHTSTLMPGQDVYADVLTLYKNVLLGYPESHTVSLAARAILDCKNFAKEWQFKESEDDNLMRLKCRVSPSYNELATQLTRPLPPAELIVAPKDVTVDELKLIVECSLRDTYCMMEKVVVKEIKMGQNQVFWGAGDVWVRGWGLDLDTELRFEGGADDWTVDCVCGAKDDDGERMVACDICQVWQHTRCNSIADNEVVPSVFKCRACTAAVA